MDNVKLRVAIQFLAWAFIALIAYATLTKIGFIYAVYDHVAPLLMRPSLRVYTHIEHVVAFAVFGALFSLAYSRRPLVVYGLVFGGAIVLELMQTLTPDRHGTLVDAVEKMAGGALGILLTQAVAGFRLHEKGWKT